MEFWKLTPNPI